MKPLLITIPHSGETIPSEVTWLNGLDEPTLMCDVDRFVDQLYLPIIKGLGLPAVLTRWHRYVIDLNRLADDVDADSVKGHKNPSGQFSTGLHWVQTTTGFRLMKQPISPELHQQLIEKYFEPFHREVNQSLKQLRRGPDSVTYHIDAHSMPSMGTAAHRDPGQRRAEIVVSDYHGKTCSAWFKDLVIRSYKDAGFEVAYNWPYIGGRVSQQYGLPEKNQHAIQVELRRDLYMNEKTKQIIPQASEVTERIKKAIHAVWSALPDSL